MVHKVGNTCPSNSTTCEKQEAYRKDVERAFGILQARWLIIRAPARGWSLEKLNFIVMSCIILDNMIVEDEWDDYTCGDSNDDELTQISQGELLLEYMMGPICLGIQELVGSP